MVSHRAWHAYAPERSADLQIAQLVKLVHVFAGVYVYVVVGLILFCRALIVGLLHTVGSTSPI